MRILFHSLGREMADEVPNSQTSSLDEAELNEIINDAQPKSTKLATKWGVKKFEEWLAKREKTCDFFTIPSTELAELLRKFYAEVQPKKQGNPLTPSSLTSIRAAIHRHLTSAPYNRNINILTKIDF